MLKKICYSNEPKIQTQSKETALASQDLIDRMSKLATDVRAIAPKSDDFLYFSIIFLKAAESAYIDEAGKIKKLASGEDAWGFFDENWKWHGNVKPHRNNNCFLPGTKILMSDCSTKDIEDVVAGDVVITHTGSQKKVITTTRTRYNGDILNIKVRNKESVSCTPEHPFYSVKHKNLRFRLTKDIIKNNVSFSFDEAYSLNKGSFLTSPALKQYVESSITPKLARLFGIFAAEGSYTKKYGRKQGLLFTIGKKEEAQADLIKSIAESEFPGCSVRKNYSKKNSTINITVTGSGIAELFYKNIGEYSHTKKLSESIVFGNDEVKKQFLIGWLDGDGCLTNYNKIIGITTSPHIAYQAHMMLNSLGISSSLKSSSWCKSIIAPTNGKSYLARKHYRLDINGTGCRELGINYDSAKYCGLFDDEIKNKKFDIFTDNHSVHSVSSIKRDKYDGFVYNFQVEDDNSYVANGLVVHNCDIFPESQLKVATSKWIGMPLCRDHESSSVDGIRGIILDAHYDEKYKQVVGLCALDKVNYPDLAKKVQNGLVRYGSMGTAVEVSICSECGNKASTQKDYCPHVLNKTAHGEINVGLKPIEYSLVVQPAEPGAILLKCLASLEDYRSEFINYGVENVDEMLGRLNEKQAMHLETIVKTACGENGCSIPQRKKIITSFLSNNGLITLSDQTDKSSHNNSTLKSYAYNESSADTNRLTSDEEPEDRFNPASTARSILGTKNPEDTKNFATEGDMLKAVERTPSAPITSVAGTKNSSNLSINQLLEDIMSETNLKKRAELRRRVAYMQGGESVDDKAYREPSTFRSDKMSETVRNTQDRQILQDVDLVKMHNNDMDLKQKLSRAELKENRLRRIAYMQGGESVDDKAYREPATYKTDGMSETVRNTQDRHLLQDADMSKLTSQDMALKEKLSRASARGATINKVAYTGPALTTRFSVKRASNGQINKSASVFEVFSGNKRVIAATAGEIFGSELANNWDWIKSEEYGKEVCRQIRASGLPHVNNLLKSAQTLPPPPDMGAGAPPAPAADAGALPPPPADLGALPPPPADLGAPMGDEGEPEGAEEAAEKSEDPAAQIDEELTSVETAVSTVRDLVNELKDKQEADVDVNVFTGKKEKSEDKSMDEGKLALSRHIYEGLKRSYRQLDSSADELAMVAETYENISKLSASQRREFVKLAGEARQDSARVLGEATSLIMLAKAAINSGGLKKSANKMEDDMMGPGKMNHAYDDGSDFVDYEDDYVSDEDYAQDDMYDHSSAEDGSDDAHELVVATLNMRKARREAIVKQAESSLLEKRAAARKALLKKKKKVKEEEPKKEMKDKKAPMKGKKVDEDKEEVKSDDLNDMSALHTMKGMEMGMRSQENMGKGMAPGMQMSDEVKPFDVRASALNSRMQQKKAEEERESYRIKLRRAYDLGMDMQRKGLLPHTKVALDKQVDDIMTFDDPAFESFKRSIANAKPIRSVKVASDLGGVNVGVESTETAQSGSITADRLLSLWD